MEKQESKRFTVRASDIKMAIKVLNSTGSTAGDYYDALRQLVGFARDENNYETD